MGELLALAPAHLRGGSTHWPATSWVQMQWAGNQAQGHGAPPVVIHFSKAHRAGWHMLRASAKELLQGPHCLRFHIAYAQRFGTCTPYNYKKSGVPHRYTPRATDATELAPWIGDWQGHLDEPRWRHVPQNQEDENFAEAKTANLLDDLQQPPPSERKPLADRGRYVVESPKKNYHSIVCYCFLLNIAVLPCGHTICTDCAGSITRCPLDRTVFVATNTARNRAVQDARCCPRISAVRRGSYRRRDTGNSRSCDILSGIHNKTVDKSGCHATGQIASLHASVATGSS